MLIMGIVFLSAALFNIYLYNDSRHWPVVEGRVVSSISTGHYGRDRATTYTYHLDSRDYTRSETLSNDRWLRNLKAGEKIMLRYNVNKPDFALIDHKQEDWQTVYNILFSAALIIVGLFSVISKNK